MSLAALINPGLLALGGALIAVPIIIHLLNRRRVQHRPWAAMQWLLAAMKRHQRRLQVENWLILLLRIAAVLLLGLALARPVLEDPRLARLFEGKRSVFLAVDTSYSMASKTQGRAVVDLAKAEADAVLSSLGGEDAVALLVTNDPRTGQSDGRAPFAVVPRSVGEEGIAKAKEAVVTLRTRDAPADWADTLTRLQRQTAKEDVNRLVVLITDFQGRDWREERVEQALADLLALPAAVRIIDVGGTERRNLTVADVKSALRRDAFVDRPLRLDVTVENQGAKPVAGAKLGVFLDGNATPIRSQLLPALDGVDAATGQPGSAHTMVELPGRAFTQAGSHVLRVDVIPPHDDPGADGLGLDSRRSFAVQVRDRIRVLAWTRTSENARMKGEADAYLRGVYERWEAQGTTGEPTRERSPLYELKTVGTETALADALARQGLEHVDLVVLANVAPRGRAVDALRDFVRGGGALLTFVGDQIRDPAVLNDAFYADPERRLLPYAYDAPEVRQPGTDAEAFAFDLGTDSGHPLARPFTGEAASTWIGLVPPRIWGRLPFIEDAAATPAGGAGDGPTPGNGNPAAPEATTGDVVLRFTDGRPAVVSGRYGMGRTLWLATSIDNGWFERSFFFLPVFLDEAAVLATRPDDARRNLEVGRRIVVTWLPRDASDAHFIAPGGAELEPTRYEGLGATDRPMLVLERVGMAGTWRLLYDREALTGGTERVEEHFAVNVDAGEGRLERAQDGEVVGGLPPESDIQILTSWEDVKETGNEVHQGEISSLLLWIAIGLLLIESLLAWLFGRRRAREPATRTEGATGETR